ncbi:MAG: MotA/TolQ/ExbB proton channel family protein [Planctomycetota bacterium]|nr:MotA/TolQ/ExbB proton channel family protein [Planctomycetota bacterium]
MPTLATQLASICVTLVTLVVLVDSQPLFGQTPPLLAPRVSELSAEELQQRLDALKKDLVLEHSNSETTAKRNADEILELEAERKRLANQLLTSRIEFESNDAKLQALRKTAKQDAADAPILTAAAKSISSAALPTVEQLLIHLREIPGSEAAIDKLRSAMTNLNWDDADDSEESLAALKSVLAEIDAAHGTAHRVTVRETEIFTTDGRRESVKLLSLGHVRFAYESADGRVGLALSSTRDATGFRWSEQVSPDVRRWVHDGIVAVERGEVGIIAFPLDPVGRLQAESLVVEPTLVERFTRGGMVMWPLAGVALIAVLLISERTWVFFMSNRGGNRLAEGVIAACREDRFEFAAAHCHTRPGAVGRVLAACLARRPLGQHAMEDSIQEQLLHELPRLQRFMGGIATLAAVAPLLGLLGTVTGIIRTFGVIRAFGNANPSLMAGGISEALLTTAAGLVIAVPILIIHSVLRGRSDRIVADAERHAAMLLTELVHAPRVDRQAMESQPTTEAPVG